MRITDQMITSNVVNDSQLNLSTMNQLNAELSSGKRILKPSDDPAGTARELSLQSVLNNLAQYKSNTDSATASLSQSLSVLTQVQSIINQAKTQALSADNNVDPSNAQQAAAVTIQSLQQELLSLANTQLNGNYIFGGTRNSTPPFKADGTYNGDTGTIQSTVSPNQTIAVNVDGQSAFKTGVDVFKLLSDLHTALVNNDTAGITSTLATADSALNNNLAIQAQVGARVQSVQAIAIQISSATVSFQTLQSNNSDADIATTIANLQASQNAYQASLQAGSKILQLSLLNFLNP